jgi:hypothetical protein
MNDRCSGFMATSSFNGIGNGNRQSFKELSANFACFHHEASEKSSIYAPKTVKRLWLPGYSPAYSP